MHAKKCTDSTEVKYCFGGQRNNGALIAQLFCYSLPFRKSNGRGNFSLLGGITTPTSMKETFISRMTSSTHVYYMKNLSAIARHLIFLSCLCLSLHFSFTKSFFATSYKARHPSVGTYFHTGCQFVKV